MYEDFFAFTVFNPAYYFFILKFAISLLLFGALFVNVISSVLYIIVLVKNHSELESNTIPDLFFDIYRVHFYRTLKYVGVGTTIIIVASFGLAVLKPAIYYLWNLGLF